MQWEGDHLPIQGEVGEGASPKGWQCLKYTEMVNVKKRNSRTSVSFKA